MNTKKIESERIRDLLVASLPTRPTASPVVGGRGYSSKEMKEAFDRLPLFIIECFNSLMDDISAVGKDSLSGEIPTGISEGHTLATLFEDLTSGNAAGYLTVLGKSLDQTVLEICERLSRLEGEVRGV